MTNKVGWAIAASTAIALNGCSEADVQSGAASISNLLNTGSFTPEQRGVRVSQSAIKPPADARPYGIDGSLSQSEIQTMKYLDYGKGKQRYSDITGSVGYAYYTTPKADYYRLPNGSYAQVSYDSEGYATGIAFDSSQVAAVSPAPAPAPPPMPEPAPIPTPIADHDYYSQPRIVPVPTLPPSNGQEAISYTASPCRYPRSPTNQRAVVKVCSE